MPQVTVLDQDLFDSAVKFFITLRQIVNPTEEIIIQLPNQATFDAIADSISRALAIDRSKTSFRDCVMKFLGVEFRIKPQIAGLHNRLNAQLAKMEPGCDDLITGFNDAWDIVSAYLKEQTL